MQGKLKVSFGNPLSQLPEMSEMPQMPQMPSMPSMPQLRQLQNQLGPLLHLPIARRELTFAAFRDRLRSRDLAREGEAALSGISGAMRRRTSTPQGSMSAEERGCEARCFPSPLKAGVKGFGGRSSPTTPKTPQGVAIKLQPPTPLGHAGVISTARRELTSLEGQMRSGGCLTGCRVRMSGVRVWAAAVTNADWFEPFILFCIVANMLCLALGDPLASGCDHPNTEQHSG